MALWVYGEGPFLEKRQGVPHFIQYADEMNPAEPP